MSEVKCRLCGKIIDIDQAYAKDNHYYCDVNEYNQCKINMQYNEEAICKMIGCTHDQIPNGYWQALRNAEEPYNVNYVRDCLAMNIKWINSWVVKKYSTNQSVETNKKYKEEIREKFYYVMAAVKNNLKDFGSARDNGFKKQQK